MYQYGGFGQFLDGILDTADKGMGPRIDPMTRNTQKAWLMREQLPFLTQIEQARMQTQAAEEADKRRFRYQYGL